MVNRNVKGIYMKNNLKKVLMIFIFILTLFTCSNVFAAEVETSYMSINDKTDLFTDDIELNDIKFVNNSYTSSSSIGITAHTVSYSTKKIRYEVVMTLYNESYTLIGEYRKSYDINAMDDESLAHMANSSYLRGNTSSDVKYYKIKLSYNDVTANSTIANKTPSLITTYKNYEYVIDAYDVNVIVNKNNTFDITEHITAYYNIPKHGIIRKIPLMNTINRTDGSTSKNRAKISNLSVDANYSVSRSQGEYSIKIGDANKTLTGKQEYTIKYNYNIGKDPLKDIDELYLNIIGTEWDTVIGNITFTITMPDEFDQTKLGFSAGKYASTGNSLVNYRVDKNIIEGSYDGILSTNSGLTIRCELPEGYFVGAGFKFNMLNLLIIILPICMAFISYVLWKVYGKDDIVVETVEFYPPAGFNSLEVGYAYKGLATSKDVTSLMIYLANKGYIKIVDEQTKSLFKRDLFKIVKLKDYDGDNVNERLFLEGLFQSAKTEVTLSDLQNKFYKTNNKIISNVSSKANKYKLFEKSAGSKTWIPMLFIILSFGLITIPPLYYYGEISMAVFPIAFPAAGLYLIVQAIGEVVTNERKMDVSFIVQIVFGLLFGGIVWCVFLLSSLLVEPFYILAYIIGIISISIIMACYIYLPKRTPYGNEILGKLKGFKNFLETAEKDRLEAMVNDNPTYFYDILPFTYVLNVSDEWIKNFEAINIQSPDWYDSPTAFDIITFNSFIDNAMSSASSAMSSSPSSDGGSSGGGSSGGGSGGGGGSSW